jgi:glycosyltransferase involved in cell wall biosynthesis
MFKQGTGGLQAHAECLARHLIKKGHQVRVITRAYTRVPESMDFLYFREREPEGLVGGVPVQTLDYPAKLKPLQWLVAKCQHRKATEALAVALYRLQARAANPAAYRNLDIVHHVGQATALLGFASGDAAKREGIPFVVQPTCHPFYAGDTPRDIRMFRLASRAFAHTAYEAEHLHQFLGLMPIDVVGNGIEDRSDGDGARFRALYNIEGPMVLFIGRRDPDKGYSLVLEAFQRLRKKRNDVSLVCMGPAGPLTKIEGPGIINLEYANEDFKHDALAACTCLCVPSEGESFGLVYMEAGRYAKPVVARRLPVLEELLDGGRAGRLVGQLDSSNNTNMLQADELERVLADLLADPVACRKIGQECRRVSDAFIWPRVVERFERGYRLAISAAKGPELAPNKT